MLNNRRKNRDAVLEAADPDRRGRRAKYLLADQYTRATRSLYPDRAKWPRSAGCTQEGEDRESGKIDLVLMDVDDA